MSISPSSMKIEKKAVEPYQIRQAMVALELGATDEKILEYVDFLTHYIPTGALYFLHVLPRFDVFDTIIERQTESLISNYELNSEVISRMDRKIKSRMERGGAVHIEFDVREGNPLEELLTDAEDIGADLVIIGQRSGVEQHGILAKNLARKARCNALIIPDQAKAALKRIMVPIDFSEHSIRALRAAIAFRMELEDDTIITCVNVYTIPNLSVYKIQKTKEQFREMLEEDHLEAFKAFLNTHVPEHKDELEIKLICREEPGVAQHLLDYAREQEAGLIVMGAKGHSKVELLLLGSVTENVLSMNESIPTLIVK